MKGKDKIMKFDYLKLADIIKNRRNEKDISTRKLGEKIGISHAEISRFENGLKPSFYFIPFIKLCVELDLDLFYLLKEVGLYEETSEKIYVVKITNIDENYFEIKARNEEEAAIRVVEFVINNEIISVDCNQKIDVEVEQVDIESEEKNSKDEEEIDFNNECENCEYYCPICGECTFGE